MVYTNSSFCKKILLLMSMLLITLMIIMSSNDANNLPKDDTYPTPKSDMLSNDSTIFPKDIEFSDKNKVVRFNKPIKKRRLPQALIIGVQKCGTRAITSMMRMHSKYAAPKEEQNFFSKEYDRGLEWYREQMPASYEDQITLEKSPNYFTISNLTVPLRIHSMNSSIRLILIVRDPVVRSISHLVHRVNNQVDGWNDFEELALSSDGKVNAKHPIIVNGLYEQAFKLYLEVFSPEQILVVDGEQLINNPLPIIQKVEKFLNLPREITEANFYFDKKKGFYCMKQNGNKNCLDKGKGREHPEVDQKVLKKLRKFFTPYNQRFYKLVGQDFGWATS